MANLVQKFIVEDASKASPILPQRYDPANTPGDWNLTVEVGRTDG